MFMCLSILSFGPYHPSSSLCCTFFTSLSFCIVCLLSCCTFYIHSWSGWLCCSYHRSSQMPCNVLVDVMFHSICIFLCSVSVIVYSTLVHFGHILFYAFTFLSCWKSLLSFRLSNMAPCEHCNSILFSHHNSCLLMITLVCLIVFNSSTISAVMVWLFIPFMNCSFSLLSQSLHLHSVAWPSVWPSIFCWFI